MSLEPSAGRTRHWAAQIGETAMDTRIDEIADGIFRLSTFVPQIAPPSGFTFNQFLVRGDEPLLFHTGLRQMFPLVQSAVSRLVAPERLRWIAFGHYEADECGAMNEWLGVAPRAEVAHGHTGCMVSLNDMAVRPPRVLADGEAIDLGNGRRVRYFDTPHIPHGWDAGVLYEESTGTLMCGDLFTQVGDGPALTDRDVVGPAIAAEDMFKYSSLHPGMGATIGRLAVLAPRTLALMHGPSFAGDGAAALRALADDYDRRIRAAFADALPGGAGEPPPGTPPGTNAAA
jgi:flavorubredoxin